MPKPRFYYCRGCEHWHHEGWDGDCRADACRYTSMDLDDKYPDVDGDGWPDWEEMDDEVNT